MAFLEIENYIKMKWASTLDGAMPLSREKNLLQYLKGSFIMLLILRSEIYIRVLSHFQMVTKAIQEMKIMHHDKDN